MRTRDQLMTEGLASPEVLDLSTLAVDRPAYLDKTSEVELASFNKLSDDEIAVPGMSLIFLFLFFPVAFSRLRFYITPSESFR